jgi:hypothetical protein
MSPTKGAETLISGHVSKSFLAKTGAMVEGVSSCRTLYVKVIHRIVVAAKSIAEHHAR